MPSESSMTKSMSNCWQPASAGASVVVPVSDATLLPISAGVVHAPTPSQAPSSVRPMAGVTPRVDAEIRDRPSISGRSLAAPFCRSLIDS